MSGEPADGNGEISKDGPEAVSPLASGGVDEHEDSDSDDHIDAQNDGTGAGTAAATKKKKKSKKKKRKETSSGQKDSESSGTADLKGRLDREQLSQLAELNPTLKEDLSRNSPADIQDLLKKLSVGAPVSGLVQAIPLFHATFS